MKVINTNTYAIFLLITSAFLTSCEAAVKVEESVVPEFTLLSGTEPVCKAYLHRLNNSHFSEQWPPYCSRPEVEQTNNFDKLNRVYLNADEILKIYNRAESFRLDSDQYRAERIGRSHLSSDVKKSLNSIKRKLRTGRLLVWRFDPMVDVDNDGESDNVVIWFNQRQSRCGSYDKHQDYPLMYAYIFNKETTEIDESKTMKIFGHPYQKEFQPTLNDFRTLNYENSFGIFKFNGVTYFDTFPYGIKYGSRERQDVDLRVYIRQVDKTKIVCEYHWNKREY